MGQLWETMKKQDQKPCSEQHCFKITQCKATNKLSLLPVGTQRPNQRLLLVSISAYTGLGVHQRQSGHAYLHPK